MITEIIPAITPSNIYDIQLLKDAMDIFLIYLTEHSDISIDIKNILDQNKVPIYEEFVKIYLNGIYQVLSDTEHNEALYDKLKTSYRAAGVDIENIDLSVDIVKLLEDEYILTNKHYKQAKGTPKAMEYIFNIIINSGIQNDFLSDNIGKFKYTEGKNLFEYTIEGTMIDEVYNQFVKPLVHPVGWAYFYQRIFYQSFTDYFDLQFYYTFSSNGLEVRCMNGDIYNKDNYLTNVSNLGESLVEDNTVIFINEEVLGNDNNATKRISVYFASGEELVSTDSPRSLILSKDNTILINYDNFDGNCGLYLNYSMVINTTVDDSINFQDSSHLASTTGKMNAIGAGNVYIGAFKIGQELVNKDVSVTYQSYTGVHDGADYTRTFSAGGIDEIETSGTYWDDDYLDFREFNFDYHVFGGEERLHDLGGKTAIDEYEWVQILEYCSINYDTPVLPDGRENHRCTQDFVDDVKIQRNWDTHRLRFESFIFDSAYVADSFTIETL